MAMRNIIKIDESKCDGCGLCVPSCAEGAIRIVDGKARLVSETFCDGLGACLGDCPQGAITLEERDAAEFDAVAVAAHTGHSVEDVMASVHANAVRGGAAPAVPAACPMPPSRFHPAASSFLRHGHEAGHSHGGGCPGSSARTIQRAAAPTTVPAAAVAEPSRLTNWPVQIALLPIRAPYFAGAHLLLAADCVPLAYAGFHRDFVAGRVALIGCPKLDDGEVYVKKLAAIFRDNDIQSVRVAFMEVPCCARLVRIAHRALTESGKDIPLELVRISIGGEIIPTDGF
ncbi:MAG TPA: 4Fe-4S binding protein [Acidobacteriota bacterium]|nr:4Fe-4S binding protein [Acidobacteriota bacterium]HQF87928.1 4Fe-4S binding protein [Acidobacteriota bacterium]HQG92262.1 4Fe-4S binding protein [Acidobacteriota bacterium]